jgi:photosystem II stability/assembly factor-like uncharacterized protein
MNLKKRTLMKGRRCSVWSVFTICAFAVACSVPGQTWTPAGVTNNYYVGVASSADGKSWIAAQDFDSILISTNSGMNWSQANIPAVIGQEIYLYSVACSSDGSNVFAGANGSLYASLNSGLTWATNEAPSGNVSKIASSSDGSRVAVAYGGPYSNILYSSNFGVTFTSNRVPCLFLGSIVSSVDGATLFGTLTSLGDTEAGHSAIYRSVDFGTTWVPTTAPPIQWLNIACSADGTKLAAVTGLNGVWLSTNSGQNWASNSASLSYPAVVACSADGTRLVIAGQSGDSNNIYTSLDFGKTWTTNNAPGFEWNGLAMSADGSILLASTKDTVGGIYTAQIPAQPSLSITAFDSNLTFSWPLPSTGFVLQQSGDLTSTNWSAVTNAVTVSNVWNQVTIAPPASGNTFYRLSGP